MTCCRILRSIANRIGEKSGLTLDRTRGRVRPFSFYGSASEQSAGEQPASVPGLRWEPITGRITPRCFSESFPSANFEKQSLPSRFRKWWIRPAATQAIAADQLSCCGQRSYLCVTDRSDGSGMVDVVTSPGDAGGNW